MMISFHHPPAPTRIHPPSSVAWQAYNRSPVFLCVLAVMCRFFCPDSATAASGRRRSVGGRRAAAALAVSVIRSYNIQKLEAAGKKGARHLVAAWEKNSPAQRFALRKQKKEGKGMRHVSAGLSCRCQVTAGSSGRKAQTGQ
jgi:hypothetical protein